MHRLTNISVEDFTADCSVCGKVWLHDNGTSYGKKTWRCRQRKPGMHPDPRERKASWHSLRDVRPEERKAKCLQCGEVDIVRAGKASDGWSCAVSWRERNARYYRTTGPVGKHGVRSSEAMRLKEELACGGCGSATKLKIDHDHKTGKIRDVLCHNCNVVIGLAKEDPAVLRSLAKYLEFHRDFPEADVYSGKHRLWKEVSDETV